MKLGSDPAELTAIVGVLLALGQRGRRLIAHRGVLLGAAGGAFFGLSDVAVKAITGLVEHGTGADAVAPWLMIAVTGGIAAQILAVKGLQEGEAVPVIALTGVTANLANIAGGILVFNDPLGHGPLAFIGQSLAFGLVVCGAALVPAGATAPATGHAPTHSPASPNRTAPADDLPRRARRSWRSTRCCELIMLDAGVLAAARSPAKRTPPRRATRRRRREQREIPMPDAGTEQAEAGEPRRRASQEAQARA